MKKNLPGFLVICTIALTAAVYGEEALTFDPGMTDPEVSLLYAPAADSYEESHVTDFLVNEAWIGENWDNPPEGSVDALIREELALSEEVPERDAPATSEEGAFREEPDLSETTPVRDETAIPEEAAYDTAGNTGSTDPKASDSAAEPWQEIPDPFLSENAIQAEAPAAFPDPSSPLPTQEEFGKGDPLSPDGQTPQEYSSTPVPNPDFTVSKTAQSSSAKPGDTVYYKIRICNTGNVTLHSVVSTEKFLGAGVKACFLPQEGLLLNENRSQAMIASLNPGQEAVLTASVVIPSEASAQQLVNQVEVSTRETGSRVVSSEAVIPLVPVFGASGSGSWASASTNSATIQTRQQVSQSVPKTSDSSSLSLWTALLLLSLTAIVSIFHLLRKEPSLPFDRPDRM